MLSTIICGCTSFLVLYVDDILFATNDLNLLHDTKKFMSNNFEMNDEAFYAVAKTHKRRSNKIYNSELTITKI